jgi:hypothetical protein
VIIPVGFAQVNMKVNLGTSGRGAEWTFGLDDSLGSPPITIANAVLTSWTTNVKGLFCNDISLTSILVKNGPNATGPSAELGVGVAYSGVGLTLPGNVAVLIRKHTGSGGRKGRGRLYHPGVFTGLLNADADTIAPASVTALANGFQAFFDDLQTAGYTPVLLHGDATTPTVITSVSCESVVATQRRRIRK